MIKWRENGESVLDGKKYMHLVFSVFKTLLK